MQGRGLVLVAMLALLGGCPNAPFTTCDEQPDISGHWTITLVPVAGGGLQTGDTIDAHLTQVKRDSGFGSLVWGSLTSSDKTFFDSVDIPQLRNNNGSKTGGVLGCEIKINVPVTTQVTDDDADNGPLRLSLAGTIVARGMISGDSSSSVLRQDDQTPSSCTWTGIQLPQ